VSRISEKSLKNRRVFQPASGSWHRPFETVEQPKLHWRIEPLDNLGGMP
jgi:hypothetical protein